MNYLFQIEHHNYGSTSLELCNQDGHMQDSRMHYTGAIVMFIQSRRINYLNPAFAQFQIGMLKDDFFDGNVQDRADTESPLRLLHRDLQRSPVVQN